VAADTLEHFGERQRLGPVVDRQIGRQSGGGRGSAAAAAKAKVATAKPPSGVVRKRSGVIGDLTPP
jgi:hypothetical protein